MAQIDSTNWDAAVTQCVRNLKSANLFTDENAQAIIEPAIEVVLVKAKTAFITAGHDNRKPRRTGGTAKAFTRSKTLQHEKKGGAPYMVVTLTGEDARDQRYGAKAFVLNYGRRRRGGIIKADYHLTNAARAVAPTVGAMLVSKAEEIYTRNIQG